MTFEVVEATSSTTTTPETWVDPTATPVAVSASQEVEGDYLEVVAGLVNVKTTDGRVVAIISMATNTIIRAKTK